MGLLPDATRTVLVERYIEESPQAEVATRLGLSEGAVEARLHRGKIALHKVLTTEFRDEATAYGLINPDDGGWQETRIWCMECGQHRLFGRFGKDHTELTLRCPGCCDPGTHVTYGTGEVLRDVKGYKPALSRLTVSTSEYFRRALGRGAAECPGCGDTLPLRPGLDGPVSSALRALTAFHVICRSCCFISDAPLHRLNLILPEGRSFWREHPRIRTLPERRVEAQGYEAIVTTFESVSDATRLEVVARRNTFEVLEIHGARDTSPPRAEAVAKSYP
jgi:hypothetical protein